jgi:hypothetical protein
MVRSGRHGQPTLEGRRHFWRDAGQRDEAVPNISQREDAVLLTKYSGATPIVRNGHDRRNLAPPRQVASQAGQNGRQPGPTPQCYDAAKPALALHALIW